MSDAVEISRLRFTSLEMTDGVVSLGMTDGVVSLGMADGVVAGQDMPQNQLKTVLGEEREKRSDGLRTVR